MVAFTYYREETVKEKNDFRKACLYGLRLKTWHPATIASFGTPTGVKWSTDLVSIATIMMSSKPVSLSDE